MSGLSGSITEVLLEVPSGPLGSEVRSRVRDRLVEGISRTVADLPPGGLVEVTLPVLRRARRRPGTEGTVDPTFAWKPAFARRSLGLAAVRACAEGRSRGPAAAVGPLAEHAVDEWRRTGWRTFHWEPWFAGLGAGGRAAVLAEATTWSTALWAAFDWALLAPRSVLGGTDDQWTCPGPRPVRLKGRCEVRVGLDPSGGHGGVDGSSALVSVSGGIPGDDWREELSYLALVAGLRSTERPIPARVLGLWPEAGVQRLAEVDEHLLHAATDRVVTTLALAAHAGGPAPDHGEADGTGVTRRAGTGAVVGPMPVRV
jgi:hypothetical protein